MITSNFKKILNEQRQTRTAVLIQAFKAMWTYLGLVLVYGMLIVGCLYAILLLGRILGFH